MKITTLTKRERDVISSAKKFETLRRVALVSIKRLKCPVGMVCGPISTGGAGSIKKNIIKFDRTINKLGIAGVPLFSQIVFERPMHRIMRTPYYQQNELHLLETFYLWLFQSGFITTLYFMPDWQTSVGARWEHVQAVRLGLQIVYLA